MTVNLHISISVWEWTVLLNYGIGEDSWSLLDSKEIKPLNPKGNQHWIFIGRTDAEAERPILWPLDVRSQLIRKDPDAGKDWRQEEKGTTEDEMVGWHPQLNGHEFEQAPGDSEGQGSTACCSLWGHDKLDMTEQLNWTDEREVYFPAAHFFLIEWVSFWHIQGIRTASYIAHTLDSR